MQQFIRRFRIAWPLLILLTVTATVLLHELRQRHFLSSFVEDGDVTSGFSNDILLVSAFYPDGHTRNLLHNLSFLPPFLGHVKTDIHFYTPKSFEPQVSAIRGDLPITIDTRFTNGFDVPPLGPTKESYGNFSSNLDGRTSESAALFNARPYLLADALRFAVGRSKVYKYAFWVDVDSFQNNRAYSGWPNLKRLDDLWVVGRREGGARMEDMFFLPMENIFRVDFLLWKESEGPIEEDIMGDHFFGGQPKSVFWFERLFYAYHDFYIDRQLSLSRSTSSFFNSLVLLYPENFISVWHGDPQSPAAIHNVTSSPQGSDLILGNCGEPKSYFQFFLASEKERDAAQREWIKQWNLKIWEFDRWTRKRIPCQLTTLIPMEWTLKRPFGWMWSPPQRTVVF